jgi:hypothetical protein
MARATGGVERLNLASVWNDLPKLPRMLSLAPWLLMAAMILLLVEILQRRTGLLSFARRRATGRASAKKATSHPVATSTLRASTESTEAPLQRDTSPTPSKEVVPKPAAESVADALSQARNRADRRTRR